MPIENCIFKNTNSFSCRIERCFCQNKTKKISKYDIFELVSAFQTKNVEKIISLKHIYKEELNSPSVYINNLDFCIYLYCLGCPLDEMVMEHAIHLKNNDIVKWLYNIGCPIYDKDFGIVQFIVQNNSSL